VKAVARLALLFIVILSLCDKAFAVERSYGLEQIPAKIPYQRAFLIFNQGSETLILQSKYELLQTSPAKSLYWIVPVPSEPEIKTLDPKNAHDIFRFIARMTQPKIIKISDYIFALFLLLSVIFCFFYLLIFISVFIQFPLLIIFRLSTKEWQFLMRLCLKVLPLFFIALIYIFFALPNLNKSTEIGNVDVIKSETVGFYDVQVIKSDNENAILTWLNENGFKYGDSDIDVFKNYVEKQWCFVVARVQTNTERYNIASYDMAAPLILKFKTDKAIYPVALKPTVDKETEVLIYTMTENKQTCGDLLPLKRSLIEETERTVQHLSYYAEKDIKAIFKDLPAKMNICKFKAKLAPKQMKEDIIFKNATDNEPYNETKIIL
jgi:hypothetical protein